MLIILSIILIVSLTETLYLLVKVRNLKKNNASDSEYEKMIDKYAPLGKLTLVISIVLLVIAFII
ncbi:hypothetical protein JGT54_05210 [Staphylococcus aureus]|uniref:hypothetical protein n=2 Tax=Staphylococcus aureus TaxID=1280 RepID=UPI0018EA2A18|nr:hypothetical protein [Staphylococcus aureus]MBJ6128901.1 hypothetical protein [Staphylococcus aureus]MBJ6141229.1 hypothetical protein [Staphylococcus aureus]MBJ6153755.1 hypothetical protein [Staphylococcus aureus]MBJ6156670.1 hypothetical protein [Staphylococcus aureus]MBJ6158145.1 hypothetical protein [Staphylococcus aureus]